MSGEKAFQLGKILFPVDFSDRCRDASAAVRTLAKEFGATVTLFHVVEVFEEELRSYASDVNARLDASRTLLDQFLTKELEGLAVERIAVAGDAARLIVDKAHDDHFDLIVMPTHGYGPFRRFLLGSVTNKVLHDADVPVMTGTHLNAVKPDVLQINNVMCAVDLGSESCRAVTYADQFAKRCGAKLTVVNAVPLFTTPVPEGWPGNWQEEANQYAKQQLDALLADRGVEAAALVVQGAPSFAIGDAAKERKSDLLVIARSARKGIVGRLGSNAYGIMCHSPVPVLSV